MPGNLSSRRSGASGQRRVAWEVADNPGPLTLDGTRSYIVGRERAVLVDPGPAIDRHLERLRERVGRRCVEAVCLTHSHADHAAGARSAAELFGAPVAASSQTLDRCGLDGLALADGDTLAVDGDPRALTALGTPGHSADHMSFLLLPERWLFTGDLVLGSGTSAILYPDGDVAAYTSSLLRAVALRPSRIYPGHGPPVESPVAVLEEYRAHRLQREDQIRSAVRGGARSVGEILSRVYGPLSPSLERAAAASISAHLAHLRARGERLPAISGLVACGEEQL